MAFPDQRERHRLSTWTRLLGTGSDRGHSLSGARPLVFRLLLVVVFTGAVSPLTFLATPEAHGAGSLSRCLGAAFQFPLIDGNIGWLYLDQRSDDPSGLHTGIDIYPPIK